jgi:hypothetical protein
MDVKAVIASQYRASLEMLRRAVAECPEGAWEDPAHKNRFWHVAYHTLFYTHLYLQESEGAFVPWAKHRDESNFLGPLPWPPHRDPKACAPYSPAEVLEYLALVDSEVGRRVAPMDLDAPSGFDWLPFGKLELQLYNIRHVQHHTGQLIDRLRASGISIGWVGAKGE